MYKSVDKFSAFVFRETASPDFKNTLWRRPRLNFDIEIKRVLLLKFSKAPSVSEFSLLRLVRLLRLT